MYDAFERLAASSARPRQHEFSQVSNNEANVFHRQTLIRAKLPSPHLACRSQGRLCGEIVQSWTSAVDFRGKTTTRMLWTRRALLMWWLSAFMRYRSSLDLGQNQQSTINNQASRAALHAQGRGVHLCSLRNIIHAATLG
jgi:hypothetical protein